MKEGVLKTRICLASSGTTSMIQLRSILKLLQVCFPIARMVPLCSSFTTMQGVTLCRQDISQPLWSKLGTHKNVMARF